MAKVGLEYARIAVLHENSAETTPSYSDCIKLGAAVKFDCKVNLSKATLFADNRLQESRAKFKDGTLSVDIDDLLDEARTLMLGHTVDKTTSEVISNAGDKSPYMGFGIVGTVERGGVTKHRAIWFCKVQFEEPSESGETEGETFKYNTTSVSGTIFTLKNGDYKYDRTFDDIEEAKAYINEKAGVPASPPENGGETPEVSNTVYNGNPDNTESNPG